MPKSLKDKVKAYERLTIKNAESTVRDRVRTNAQTNLSGKKTVERNMEGNAQRNSENKKNQEEAGKGSASEGAGKAIENLKTAK